MKAIITVGISGSGKTVWAKAHAKETGAIISNRDDLRFSMTGAKDWSDYKFKRQFETAITHMQRHQAMWAAEMKKDFILSDTNLNNEKNKDWEKYLKELGYTIETKIFDVSFEEALKRNAVRTNGVGKDVLYRQWQAYLKYTGKRTYTPDFSLRKAVIFDVDGTLAHMVDRKPYDWTKVGQDTVDPHVARMLVAYARDGYAILVVSGRDGVCYADTCQWIIRNGLMCNEIYMRRQGDMRKDTVVKEEIFWQAIAPFYNVEAVFDDRPSVVRMWHDIGIQKVFAVADQNIEF